ncbi:DUF6630 family protein [Pedobacter duraquae]|uniref:DUF6630 domain-containing protein n=1 Tax=Pedobacter duraquae TaxID=425511 RepID=A0A4V3C3X6_9SPHI|nr:hypothetical protein [Pedobacter duraquae]TDO23808.1 hypothetical protein CLV32_0093 [Pedobacter duraquae]
MITEALQAFAKTLMDPERYEALLVFMKDRDELPQDQFLSNNKRILEPVIDVDSYIGDPEIIDEQVILLAFAVHHKYVYSVDWSGEEHPGQVKRAVGNMLKLHFNVETYQWKKLNIDLQHTKRGDYLPLLFSLLNDDLENHGFSIGFFDTGDDEYHYFVMEKIKFQRLLELQDSALNVIDTKTYQLYLIGGYTAKIILYLKNKFAIPLNEIKTFIANGDVLVETGNRNFIAYHQKLIGELGGESRIQTL